MSVCGRFTRSSPIETFAQLFNAFAAVDMQPFCNIAPSTDLLAARNASDGGRELATLH